MKAVVVHCNAAVIEKDWAQQFAGLDAAVKKEFIDIVPWDQRVSKVFTVEKISWAGIVLAVSNAAAAAGAGGVVVIASGHGGFAEGDETAGIVNWDASDGNVNRAWNKEQLGQGLFWDEYIMGYVDPIHLGNPPTHKAEDEAALKKNKDAVIPKKRLEAFDALMQISKALSSNKVQRLAFTVCSAGRAPKFLDRMATHLKTDVACFKFKTKVLDDSTFGIVPGKARLIMESDQAADGKGSNTRRARVFSPNLDNSAIAYVAKK
jgi:hypothetical protein